MGILLRVIKTIFFVAVILALGQIKVASKPVAEHLTTRVQAAWKAGPEPWLRQSSARIESETLRNWLAKLGIEAERTYPRRATKPRPIVDDIEARDRARLQKLLEKESL
jgi:hypothetical protein